MPEFAHLPLILKPTGNGKLSKRDGVKLGIPVFPISWVGETEESSFTGFREAGFLPEAMLNFLAFLGWNPGTEQEIPADFVFLAMGFTGPEKTALMEQLEVELDERGNIKRGLDYQSSQEGIFVAGDAGRGQSLIVWAIAEGRSAAAEVDKYLTGDTQLPSPILPTARPMMV